MKIKVHKNDSLKKQSEHFKGQDPTFNMHLKNAACYGKIGRPTSAHS